MILAESFEYVFQDLEIPVVGVGVQQEIVNVDYHVLKVSKYSLH
jgi:hypothetical protein